MNTRQILHFLALLDHGSLAAAAEAVHLSQPALSRSIRSMEELLGVPLFDRTERRLRPTVYARAYEPHARRMIFDEKEGARLLTLMRSGESGSLTFGMGSSLAPILIEPIVLGLMNGSPGVKLRSVIETSERLVAALLAERLDFFVGDIRVACEYADLHVLPLYPCTFGWFARCGHVLASKRKVNFDDMHPFPLIAAAYFEPSLALRLGDLYGLSAPVIDCFSIISDDIGTVHSLLQKSDSIVASTELAIASQLESGDVVSLAVDPPLVMDMTLGIVHHAERTLVPAAQRAFEIIQDCFSRIGMGRIAALDGKR
ncbi:LysR family transcriptional regulator [Burkholderia ubonensis]|uniref:LysR family transcriptional regulator n=1 Tax=Burkholderia ubonensis TaxID=101571 RepID=UPI0007551CCB|nr:LysR family transcriptional regulator [Burkholderia ubonensis]KVR12658.1 LysR family transcriptional regulator [Burkholderia ubonensis]